MAFKARKTEHYAAKKERGAYWGRKVDAKRESNRKRREAAKGHRSRQGKMLGGILVYLDSDLSGCGWILVDGISGLFL